MKLASLNSLNDPLFIHLIGFLNYIKILWFSSYSTTLHTAVKMMNNEVFCILLQNSAVDLDLENSAGEPALWLALQHPIFPGEQFIDASFAGRLVKRGSCVSSVNSTNG